VPPASSTCCNSILQKQDQHKDNTIMASNYDLVPLPASIDVMCGTGYEERRHSGNIFFTRIVSHFIEEYNQATSKSAKMQTTKKILDLLTQSGVRFLKKCPVYQTWHLANPKVGRDKIGHFLRLHRCQRPPPKQEETGTTANLPTPRDPPRARTRPCTVASSAVIVLQQHTIPPSSSETNICEPFASNILVGENTVVQPSLSDSFGCQESIHQQGQARYHWTISQQYAISLPPSHPTATAGITPPSVGSSWPPVGNMSLKISSPLVLEKPLLEERILDIDRPESPTCSLLSKTVRTLDEQDVENDWSRSSSRSSSSSKQRDGGTADSASSSYMMDALVHSVMMDKNLVVDDPDMLSFLQGI
jgi:hypothetical protein